MRAFIAGFALAAVSLPAASVSLPPFERATLPNGVVLCLMPKRDVPLVTFRAVVRGGTESEPEGQAGLATITADLLSRGTRKRSAEQFAEALEFFGSGLSTSVSRQHVTIGVETLAATADKVLDLMLEALLAPSFPEDEFKKLTARSRDQLRQMKDNPQAALSRYFEAFLFGREHPYGRLPDEVSLGNLRLESVRAYYDAVFCGANLTFVAVGDFDPQRMKARVSEALGAVKPGSAHRWRRAAPPRYERSRLLLIDKPDATQTYFAIGHAGIHRTHPDRIATQLVNTLFGGRFTSMLNDALRVSAGLTYGARSSLDQDRLEGAFRIQSYTRTAATLQAIDLALEVLQKLRDQGIDAGQLASAKAYVKGALPRESMETAGQLGGLLAEMEVYGLKRGEFDDLFARIDAVTLEQANAAVRAYFGSAPLQFVVFGNAAAIRESLKKYAPEITEVKASDAGWF